MKFLRLVLAVLAAFLAHLLAVRLLPHWGDAVGFLAIVLVLYARRSSVVAAALLGCVLGWMQDGLSGSLYGLHGIAGTLAGAAVARVGQQVTLQPTLLLSAVFAVVVAFEEVVVATLLRLLLVDPPAPDPAWVLLRAASTALVGAAVVVGLRRLGIRWSSYRRHRRPKVRFEGRRS